MKIHIIIISAVVVAFSASLAIADGMPIKDGRFQGKVTVLDLTEEQVNGLSKEKFYLTLTLGQKSKLFAEAGVAPSKLIIYFTKDGENECTCFAFNLGLLYSPGKIEVPHHYLVNDAEAEENERQLKEIQ